MFKPSHIYAFSLGAGLTLILMLFIGYGLDGDMGFCKLQAAGSAGETPVTCAREWIGALSGWVAAAGALAIGSPTLRWLKIQTQLRPMEKQIEKIGSCIEFLKTEGFDAFYKNQFRQIAASYEASDVKLITSELEKLSSELANAIVLIPAVSHASPIWLKQALQLKDIATDMKFMLHYPSDGGESNELFFFPEDSGDFREKLNHSVELLENMLSPIIHALETEEIRLKSWVTQHSIVGI
nr:hypothetical protein [uncultured Cohaesibacter sp.]